MQQFLFVHKSESVRLDTCLKTHMPSYSRNFLVTLLENKQVLVNNIFVTKSSFKVKFSDQIVVNIPKTVEINTEKVNFKIIDDQKDFFIIDKPAGVLTHPAATCANTPSIAQSIIDQISFPDEFSISNRAGIVHRLDKDTSGLLIIAKNPQGQSQFADIFQNRKLIKKYYAICKGIPKQNQFIINTPIGRDPKAGTKMKVYGIAPKEALSVVNLVETFQSSGKESLCLLEVQILTGRTHQIRVHLASIGLPIVGDKVYGITSNSIDRQALHAHYLEFEYEKKLFRYQSSLPEDIKNIVSKKFDSALRPVTLK